MSLENSNSIEEDLKRRNKIYGDFDACAYISQHLKGLLHDTNRWWMLNSVQKEALEQICTKIARIINAEDKYYLDSWQDIAGYVMLVVEDIKRHMAAAGAAKAPWAANTAALQTEQETIEELIKEKNKQDKPKKLIKKDPLGD